MVVERDKPGGICLNVGCIPSKALINASKYYDKLRHGADIGILADNLRVDMAQDAVVEGRGRRQADRRRAHAAQGQRLRLPHRHRRSFTGRNTVEVDGRTDGQGHHHRGRQHRHRHRLAADRDPGLRVRRQARSSTRPARSTSATVPERFVVIGGGYIGIEIGTLYAKLGSQGHRRRGAAGASCRATIPRWSSWSPRKLKKLGVEVMTGAKAKAWAEKGGRAAVTRRDVGGKEATSTPTRCWSSVGRRPNSRASGLEAVGVKIERGFVPVDRQHAHQRARHLRHRRRGRAADAGAQGVAARPRWWPR